MKALTSESIRKLLLELNGDCEILVNALRNSVPKAGSSEEEFKNNVAAHDVIVAEVGAAMLEARSSIEGANRGHTLQAVAMILRFLIVEMKEAISGLKEEKWPSIEEYSKKFTTEDMTLEEFQIFKSDKGSGSVN